MFLDLLINSKMHVAERTDGNNPTSRDTAKRGIFSSLLMILRVGKTANRSR